MKQSHWYEPYRAAEILGDILEAAIEVTKTTKKPPPKPTDAAERPTPDKGRPVMKG